MLSEEARYSRDEHHVAVGVLRLQRRDATGLVDLPVDMDDTRSEIDVRPVEPEQLPRAQPGEDGRREQRPVFRRRSREERIDLVAVEDPHLVVP